MINQNVNNGGIYRAFIISADSDIRIYIPGLFNDTKECPINSDSTLNMEIFQKSKDAYPKPMWCIPNLEAKQHEQIHPCWVVFENGDVTRPIIMGFLGKGIKYSAGSGGGYIPPSIYVPNGTTGNVNGDYIFKQLIAAGASIGGACAVLGNIFIESAFSPTADNGSHRGIAQWDYNHETKTGRWYDFIKWCSENGYENKQDTIEAQTAFLIHDLQTEAIWMDCTSNQGWNNICKEIKTESEVESLTDTIRLHYERRGNQMAEECRKKAIEYWNMFKNGKIENGEYKAGNYNVSTSGFAWPYPAYPKFGTRNYGYNLHPIYKTNRWHSGIDIGGTYGDNIIASKDGTVTMATTNGGYGLCVIIDHGNNVSTLYGHCSKLLVSKGQTVTQGTIIAQVGSTGVSTGPHLHFEVRVNGSTVDPKNYVSPK